MGKRFYVMAALLLSAAVFSAISTAQVARPRPGAAQPKEWEKPKDGALYVLEIPSRNLQTLLVLKVIDGGTFEGAYLVPVTVKIPGREKATDKASFEALDKVIGGRLVNASLRGKNAQGVVVGDIYLGDKSKDDPDAPNGWLTDYFKAPAVAPRPARPAQPK